MQLKSSVKRFYPLFLILMLAVQFLAGSIKAGDFQFLYNPQAILSPKFKANLDDIELVLRNSPPLRASASEKEASQKVSKEENIESRKLSVGGGEKSFLSNFGVLTYENLPDEENPEDKSRGKKSNSKIAQ